MSKNELITQNTEMLKYSSELDYNRLADMVTDPNDSVTIKMTKRGRSTKIIKGSSSLTKLELKNCDRYYMTRHR